MKKKLMDVFSKCNIKFENDKLLNRAITHSSYANQNNLKSNERLEFLGDAVLEICVTKFLFAEYPEMDEGELTKKRSRNVCESALSLLADELDLKGIIIAATGTNISPSILSDAFEAILGAIYWELGIEKCEDFLNHILIPRIKDGTFEEIDYKSTLQEVVQSSGQSLIYETISEKGPAHNKEFVMKVGMGDLTMGEGKGKSKKIAEQQAAKIALEKLAKNIKK